MDNIGNKSTDADRALAAELISLPDEHLLEVLRQVFAERRPNPEEDAYNRNRFFLATASSLLADDEVTWEPWEIEAVAYPDPDHYDGGLGPDYGFCQFGECLTCGTATRSNVKNAICPICGTSVYGT